MRNGFVLGALAVAISTVGSNPAVGQPDPISAQVHSVEHHTAARDLAEVLSPDGTVDQQIDSLLKELFDQLYRNDPTFPELERAYPGLRAAITDRVRPVIVKSALRVMPLYRADLAKLYGDNLTTAELREATVFFGSPEMQALTGSMRRNFKFRRTTASALEERDISEADIQGDIRSSATEIAAEMTPQQRARISAFMASPLGRKLTALNPQKLALNTKWFNYSTPEMEKEIEVAMAAGMIDHIAKTDPETAKEMRAMLNPDGTIRD